MPRWRFGWNICNTEKNHTQRKMGHHLFRPVCNSIVAEREAQFPGRQQRGKIAISSPPPPFLVCSGKRTTPRSILNNFLKKVVAPKSSSWVIAPPRRHPPPKQPPKKSRRGCSVWCVRSRPAVSGGFPGGRRVHVVRPFLQPGKSQLEWDQAGAAGPNNWGKGLGKESEKGRAAPNTRCRISGGSKKSLAKPTGSAHVRELTLPAFQVKKQTTTSNGTQHICLHNPTTRNPHMLIWEPILGGSLLGHTFFGSSMHNRLLTIAPPPTRPPAPTRAGGGRPVPRRSSRGPWHPPGGAPTRGPPPAWGRCPRRRAGGGPASGRH